MDSKEVFTEWMDAHRDEFLADLKQLVAVKSVKGEPLPGAPFGKGPHDALLCAMELFKKYGFAAKNYDGYACTADLCDGKRALDILAHLDVVGEGAGWDTDPYTVVLKEDGCVYGRGTADDKGPALAALYAMRAIKELGLKPEKSVRLILGTDEESGSKDMEYYFSLENSAPNTFTPDSEFPIYNTEKGMYKPVFEKKWEAAAVTPRVSSLKGGFRINVIPSDAEAVVLGMTADEIQTASEKAAAALGVSLHTENVPGGAKLLVKGTGAHASTPEVGNNGITALLRLLSDLPLADCPSTETIRQLSSVFPHGDGLGNALGIAMADEISGPLTVAFTLLTMDENGVNGQFDSRIPLCANDVNCRAVVEKDLGGMGFTVNGTILAPHHTPAEGGFIRTLLRCYEQYTGRKGECLATGGGTYVHDIEGGVAFGADFPDLPSCMHGANERSGLKNLLTAAAIFAQVIFDLCCCK